MVTNTKSLSLQIVLCLGLLTGSTQPIISPTALTECYQGADSSFKYLEFIFVEQPKNAIKASAQKAQSIMLATTTVAVIAANYWLSMPAKDAVAKVDSTVKAKADGTLAASVPSSPGLKIDLSTISGGVLGLVLYDMYRSYLEQNIKHDTLIKFLKNWDFHRQYIPAQLAPAFDELAQAFTTSRSKTLTNAQVSEIFAVIEHLLEHEFAKRYEKDKKKDADTLGTLKTITDISKNLK